MSRACPSSRLSRSPGAQASGEGGPTHPGRTSARRSPTPGEHRSCALRTGGVALAGAVHRRAVAATHRGRACCVSASARVAPENRNERRATDPNWGRAWRVRRRTLPQSSFATVATRRRGENNRSRYRGRRPAPPDFYPAAAQANKSCYRAFSASRHAKRQHVRKTQTWLVLVSLSEVKRRGQPCLRTPIASPPRACTNCQGQQRLFGTKLTHGRDATTGAARRHDASSPLIADGAQGGFRASAIQGEKAIAHEASARAIHTTPAGAPRRKWFCGKRS
jgi:hypothetical protein